MVSQPFNSVLFQHKVILKHRIEIHRMDVFCKVSSLERDDFFIQMCTGWAEKLAGRELKRNEKAYFLLDLPLEEVGKEIGLE